MRPGTTKILPRVLPSWRGPTTSSEGRTARRMAMALAVLVALALGHVWLHFQVLDVGYAMARETRIAHLLADRNEKLRVELAMRRSPGAVEQRAREELEMTPPEPGAIRVLRVPAEVRR